MKKAYIAIWIFLGVLGALYGIWIAD